VCDNGVGISPAFLPHLFERFRQEESGIRRPGGLGLGLNISKQLVELHGGTISAASDGEGTGATFRVVFPV
jgi:signal transduction histidine kinase